MERIKSLLHNKSFWTRLITGIIFISVITVIFILGYTTMLVVLGIISLMGIWEVLRATKLLYTPFAVTAVIADILYYILIGFYDREYITLYMVFMFAIYAIANIIIYILKYPGYQLSELFGAFFSVFYIGVPLSFLYITRVHAWGAYLVWLAVWASWGADVFAYLGGMLFGTHRVFPLISPKKTREGCICGILGSGLLGFLYALCVHSTLTDFDLELLIFPLVCMLGSLIGMFGDLFASAIKRTVGIKDYSNLLPGHGGIMDRFDSIILVSPVIYAITIIMRFW